MNFFIEGMWFFIFIFTYLLTKKERNNISILDFGYGFELDMFGTAFRVNNGDVK